MDARFSRAMKLKVNVIFLINKWMVRNRISKGNLAYASSIVVLFVEFSEQFWRKISILTMIKSQHIIDVCHQSNGE